MKTLFLLTTLILSQTLQAKVYKNPKLEIIQGKKGLISANLEANMACELIKSEYSYARNFEIDTKIAGSGMTESLKILSANMQDLFTCSDLTGEKKSCARPLHEIKWSRPYYKENQKNELIFVDTFLYGYEIPLAKYKYFKQIECE